MPSSLLRFVVPMLVALAFAGASIGALFAQGTPNDRICGGDPPEGSTDRTNNANCAQCKSGCKFGDDKFKVCEDKDKSTCNNQALPDVKVCSGDLWTKKDCTGKQVGTCQNNMRYCK